MTWEHTGILRLPCQGRDSDNVPVGKPHPTARLLCRVVLERMHWYLEQVCPSHQDWQDSKSQDFYSAQIMIVHCNTAHQGAVKWLPASLLSSYHVLYCTSGSRKMVLACSAQIMYYTAHQGAVKWLPACLLSSNHVLYCTSGSRKMAPC